MKPNRITYPSPSFSHYWQQGEGVAMLQKLKSKPSETEVDVFSELYMQSDAEADKIIKEVFDVLGYKKTMDFVNAGLNNDFSDDCPVLLKEFLQKQFEIPDWLNYDLINAGSIFCRRSGVLGLIVLRNFCLMGGYESSAINKPLIYTAELKKVAGKRIAETTDFWVNVSTPNALEMGKHGFKSCVKLRLMHALARNHIQRSETWSNAKWGLPLNQADMVATNLGFSLIFLDGLKRLGMQPSELEVKGLFHFWKYLGYLQGIPLAYLPDDETHAIEILYKWTITQPNGDEDSVALAQSLMNAPLESSYPKYKIQKWLIYKVNIGFNNFFLTENARLNMQLPKSSFVIFPYIIRQIVRWEEKYIKDKQKLVERGQNAQLKIRDEMVESYENEKKLMM